MNKLFNSRLWRALDFLATLFVLNLLWLLGCLPVVTAGASTAALCHACLRILQNRQESSWNLFRDGFRDNLRQATAVWIVYLVLLLDAGLVLWTRQTRGAAPAWASSRLFLAAAAVIGLTAAVTAVYIFGVIACYDCTTRQCFVNALGLAFSRPLWTLLLTAMTALTGIAVYLAPFLGMIAPSVCCYFQCRILLRIFRAQERSMRPPGTEDQP